MIICKIFANLWGVYRRCAYVVVLEHMIYHYVVLFGEGSVSEIGGDIWASGLCTSFKENTMPCLQLDTNHLNYATAHRRWCTVSAAPPWVSLFHKQIHANRDTASSPIINLRWRVNFDSPAATQADLSLCDSWTWPALRIFMLLSVCESADVGTSKQVMLNAFGCQMTCKSLSHT